jgi:hypothetical protein
LPLTAETKPSRPPDLENAVIGQAWVEKAEWFYGGVGFCGFNKRGGSGCSCWNCRFDVDHFGRSFAPEMDRYSVAVLDSSGNLILRVGKYGNVDDGLPLRIADRGLRNQDGGMGGAARGSGNPKSEIPNPRSIGGDEVALFYACFTATHTDRRLFIADVGNARILSVKLGYNSEECVALKTVKDHASNGGSSR